MKVVIKSTQKVEYVSKYHHVRLSGESDIQYSCRAYILQAAGELPDTPANPEQLLSVLREYTPDISSIFGRWGLLHNVLCPLSFRNYTPDSRLSVLKGLLEIYPDIDLNQVTGFGSPPLLFALQLVDSVCIINWLLENGSKLLIQEGPGKGRLIQNTLSLSVPVCLRDRPGYKQCVKDGLYNEIFQIKN